MSENEFTELEMSVLDMILSKNDEVSKSLKNQLLNSKVGKREYTGVGFFTDIEVKKGISPLKGKLNLYLGKVHAEIPGIAHGAGFILFVKNGFLSMLEGYTYGEDKWPEKVYTFTLKKYDFKDERKVVELKRKFASRGSYSGNILLFKPKEAIKFMDASKKEGLYILGLDGFHYTPGGSIQPSMDDSIDLSDAAKGSESNWNIAKRFIEKYTDSDMWFEVMVCTEEFLSNKEN